MLKAQQSCGKQGLDSSSWRQETSFGSERDWTEARRVKGEEERSTRRDAKGEGEVGKKLR